MKAKVNPFEKKDAAKDKKMGIKENSPRDKKMDTGIMAGKSSQPKVSIRKRMKK